MNMKKINVIYKSLLLLCAVCIANIVDAQVLGDSYKNKTLITPINKEDNFESIFKSVSAKYEDNEDATRTDNTDAQAGKVTVAAIFDGTTGNWWSSSKSAIVNIDVEFTSEQNLSGFNVYRSQTIAERESKINVFTSSDGIEWDSIGSIENIEGTNIRSYNYYFPTITLTKYLRLQLIPSANSNRISLDAITLYSGLDVSAVTSEKYQDVTILHKRAKWFDLRNSISEAAQAMDTFDDDTEMFTLQDNHTQVQASHTYLDTLYVHKGTSVTLEIPDKLDEQPRVNSYQRWYSFRTDGSFRTLKNGDDEVWDLLTPYDDKNYYRYANGYVGKPSGDNMYRVNFYVPTDDEFKELFGDDAAASIDNNYYLVACDVSAYTDYSQSFSGSTAFNPTRGNAYEPTLTHRVLFYIVTVDDRNVSTETDTWKNGMGRLVGDEKLAYRGGTIESGKKYLEEYDITFPFTRVSNYTLELVALSKDAWSYAIPGATIEEDHDELDIKLFDNTSGIILQTTKLSGMNRIIQFKYPNTNSTDGTQYVRDNNSKATICVTKTVGDTTYNIARYNLTFVRDTRLLTQSQLKQIEAGTIQDKNLKYYQFRTDKYLEENYELLTSLNFDYDPDVAVENGQPEFYPFPISWTANSYSFFDGSKGTDFINVNKYPEWGYYSIMKTFVEKDHWVNGSKNENAARLPESTYHLYVDASDRPGVIARLPFRDKLCKGSELFVTAWVKSAGFSQTTDDAGMLFSIMGVRKDNVLGTVYEPIYRHASSQIRRTDFLSGMLGTGSNTNEWMQMYFSFIIDADTNYESYALQIDNNSASTNGGDMYLDDVRVYIARPNVNVKQKKLTCDENTLMTLELDWEQLLSRLGLEESTTDEGFNHAIDFCFVDKKKYEAYLAEHPDDYKDAIEESHVALAQGAIFQGGIGTLYYSSYFYTTGHIYDEDPNVENLVRNHVVDDSFTPKKYGFRYRETNEGKKLAIDLYAAMTQNRDYIMFVRDHSDNNVDFDDFYPSDECSIKTEFRVNPMNQVLINGQVVKPEDMDKYCTGQAFEFSVNLKYKNDQGEYVDYTGNDIYFDWFFGTMDEYKADYAYKNGAIKEDPVDADKKVNLKDALTAFRTEYPGDVNVIDQNGTYHIDAEPKVNFEVAHKALIEYFLNSGKTVGLNRQLVLYKKSLDIRLLDDGLDLVVAPIPLSTGDGNLICTTPIELRLEPGGKAPVVLPGFEYMSYTDYNSTVEREDYYPAMRIGLKQIEASSENKPIRINLRNAKFAFDSGATDTPSNYEPDHIGLMPKEKELYLISSNDPALHDLLNPTDGEYDRHQYSIGKVVSFYAKPCDETTAPLPDNHMDIYFDLTNPMSGFGDHATTDIQGQVFTPREGYEYRFGVHFEEHKALTGQSEDDYVATPGSCYNYMEITMKVVPEYLVWQGKVDADGKIDNWNEDSVWKRISSDEINKSKDDQPDYFTDGNNQNENGYVPMLFTKVIIPENSQVALHSAGFTGSSDTYRGMKWTTNRPEYIKQPAKVNIPEDASVGMTEGHPIHYDMMVFTDEQGNMSTKPFRVNLCNEIHFEPGAEMMHAELLDYKKAWVDYQLAGGRWYALSSPLKGVVSGDFYTDRSGTEEQEYFTPINWSDNDNSRTNPSVYQRGWKNANATMVGVSNGTEERAIAGNWSAVYNKADEGYDAGTGFSLKVLDLPAGTNNATFRLPKADKSYTYLGGTTTTEGTITRTYANKLHVTDLNTEATNPITVTLKANGNNSYYLVGNPFMAHLDMEKFFDENTGLEPKYWVVKGDNQEVGVGGDNGLIDTDNGKIAPLSSFFVTKKANSTMNNEVVFTADMQVLGEVGSTSINTNALTITATTTDGRTSRAAVAYDMAASADYEASEDAELFLDSNLGDVPMVYTVAGTMATSINRTSELYNIPLGVYGNKQEMVTLSFGGLNQFSSATLYDAQEQTETPLHEGKTISVPAGTSGRYFLRAGTPTGNEVIARNAFLVYSVGGGKVMVISSNTPLKDIRVYTMGGAQVRSIQASGMQQEIYLNRGIYLITVSDQDGLQETRKVLVR